MTYLEMIVATYISAEHMLCNNFIPFNDFYLYRKKYSM